MFISLRYFSFLCLRPKKIQSRSSTEMPTVGTERSRGNKSVQQEKRKAK